jgi:hypothetical protein
MDKYKNQIKSKMSTVLASPKFKAKIKEQFLLLYNIKNDKKLKRVIILNELIYEIDDSNAIIKIKHFYDNSLSI